MTPAPEGLTWGWRVVNADLTSSHGYRWPWPGNWAECDPKGRPFSAGSPCPLFVGDGLCVALTPYGAASGGIPLHTVLVVGYHEADVLGRDEHKVRVKRAFVLDAWDAWKKVKAGSGANLCRANLCMADLSGANLSGANLCRANLCMANLSGADLSGANLCRADLCRADLSGANLCMANLSGADLSGANLCRADLSGAYLRGAYLRGAYLSGANLRGAYLRGAYLSGANLRGANLSGAEADTYTRWADGCDPKARGVVIR